jgi:hypothetical protein
MRRFSLVFLLTLPALCLFGQKKNEVFVGDFDFAQLNKCILTGLNKFRKENGLDTFDVQDLVLKASEMSSSKMAEDEKVDAKTLQFTTPKNLKKAGGSGKGEEMVLVTPMGKGKDPAKPEDIAQVVIAKWAASKKEREVVLRPSNTYAGITSTPDENGKRVYVSVVFGNYQSFNEGAKHKKELKVPFNTKSKKLKEADPRKCKNCEKFKYV